MASPPHNNVFLHEAIYAAPAGSVLVVDTGGGYEAGYWGEVMTVAATVRGLAGLVLDGCVRDGEQLRAMDFPVFARGLCIRGTGKFRTPPGVLGERIRIGDVHVEPGDWVLGDLDGVVVVPRAELAVTITATESRERKEAEIMAALRAGARTLDIYGL